MRVFDSVLRLRKFYLEFGPGDFVDDFLPKSRFVLPNYQPRRCCNVTGAIDIAMMAAVMKKLRVCRVTMTLKFTKAAALGGSGRVKGRLTNLHGGGSDSDGCCWFRYRISLKETSRQIEKGKQQETIRGAIRMPSMRSAK